MLNLRKDNIVYKYITVKRILEELNMFYLYPKIILTVLPKGKGQFTQYILQIEKMIC